MFGRGTWAIVGLAKESLEAFRASLEDRAIMAGYSQMAASAVTRHFSSDAIGINPFRAPRLDEEHPIGLEHQEALAQYAKSLGFEHEVADCQDIVMINEDRKIRVMPDALPVLFWTTGDAEGASQSRITSWGSLSDALTRYEQLPA